jgi:hypothetical protein
MDESSRSKGRNLLPCSQSRSAFNLKTLNDCASFYEECDEELIRFGKAGRFLCRDKDPSEVFVIQLNEASAEWLRRYPKQMSQLERYDKTD